MTSVMNFFDITGEIAGGVVKAKTHPRVSRSRSGGTGRILVLIIRLPVILGPKDHPGSHPMRDCLDYAGKSMFALVLTAIHTVLGDRRGVTAIEYALIASAFAVVIFATVVSVGGKVLALYTSVGGVL